MLQVCVLMTNKQENESEEFMDSPIITLISRISKRKEYFLLGGIAFVFNGVKTIPIKS